MKGLNIDIWSTNSQKTIHIINNIISVDFSSLDRGSVDDIINWGIYANSGTVEFIDTEKEFANFIKQENLEQIRVAIFISSYTKRKRLATFDLEDFTLSKTTGKVSLQLADPILKWQDIQDDRYYKFSNTTLKALASELASRYSISLNFTITASSMLTDSVIYCPDFEANSFWGNMVKICVAGHCRIYSNSEGEPEFSYDDETVSKNILISPYHILDIKDYVSKEKTKIPNPYITAKSRFKYTDERIKSIPFVIYNVSTTDGNAHWENNIDNSTNEIFYNKTLSQSTESDIATFKGNFELLGKIKQITKIKYLVTRYNHAYLPSPERKETNVSIIPITANSAFYSYNNRIALSFQIQTAKRIAGQNPFVIPNGKAIVYADYYEDSEDMRYVIGDGASFDLPTNDLIQVHSLHNPSEPLGEFLARRVLQQYGKGIECYEIECIVSDYYYEDGTLALNGANEGIDTFKKYDVVTPYIIVNGKSEPLSVHETGKPKKFRVIGVKYNYKGHLKQTLYLQEIPTLEL